VTNLRGEPVQLEPDLVRLIQLLDGSRDRAEIERSDVSGDSLESSLRQLAKLALLLK
jgi:hypothetical protein